MNSIPRATSRCRILAFLAQGFVILVRVATLGAQPAETVTEPREARVTGPSARFPEPYRIAELERAGLPTSEILEMISGPHRLEVAVIDAESGEPILDARVNGDIIGERPANPPAGDKGTERQVRYITRDVVVGSLETREAGDPTTPGVVAFPEMAPIIYRIVARSPRHAAGALRVKVPDAGPRIEIRLRPARTVRGRLVPSRPVEDLDRKTLRLLPASENREIHLESQYRTGLAADGTFEFRGLPADIYGIGERNPEWLPLDLPALDLRTVSELDLGDIVLTMAPVLNVELVRPDGSPIGSYGYRVSQWSASRQEWNRAFGTTDAAGRATRILSGFHPGVEAFVRASEATPESRDAPVLPDCVSFIPSASESTSIRIVHAPNNEVESPVRLRVSDRATGAPVPRFEGVVAPTVGSRFIQYMRGVEDFDTAVTQRKADDSAPRRFSSIGDSGVLEVADVRFRVPGNPLNLDEDESDETAGTPNERSIRILVRASGFADRTFLLSERRVHKGERAVLEMDREAVVTGRILFAPTMAPVRVEDYESLPEPNRPQGSSSESPGSDMPWRPPTVTLLHPFPEKSASWSGEPFYRQVARVRCDAEGRFRVEGILPAEGWTLRVESPRMTSISIRNLHLVPGENDVGDLQLTRPGTLELEMVGPDGRRREEAACIQYDGPRGFQFQGTGGLFRIPLLHAPGVSTRFALRSTEPAFGESSFGSMDGLLRLDPAGTHRMEVRWIPGSPLEVRVPADAYRAACGDLQELAESDPWSTVIALKVLLVSLEPDPNGFVRTFELTIPALDGAADTDFSGVIPDVAPGRYVARLDMMDMAASTTPLGFVEFTMPDTPHGIEIRPEGTRVTISRAGAPKEARGEHATVIARLERIESEPPRVASPGGARLPEHLEDYDPEPRMEPIRTYWGWVTKGFVFRAVPPGEYRILFFERTNLSFSEEDAYHEERLVLEEGRSEALVEVPWREATPSFDARARFESLDGAVP